MPTPRMRCPSSWSIVNSRGRAEKAAFTTTNGTPGCGIGTLGQGQVDDLQRATSTPRPTSASGGLIQLGFSCETPLERHLLGLSKREAHASGLARALQCLDLGHQRANVRLGDVLPVVGELDAQAVALSLGDQDLDHRTGDGIEV